MVLEIQSLCSIYISVSIYWDRFARRLEGGGRGEGEGGNARFVMWIR